MRSFFWDDTDSNCFKVYVIECESKLEQPDPLSDNVVSDKSLKEIRIKNLNRIVLAHKLAHKLFEEYIRILTSQITWNVDVMRSHKQNSMIRFLKVNLKFLGIPHHSV